MIRPEIRDGLWRWREVIAALALAAVGLWWGTVSFGIVQWIGWGMAALGAMLAFSAAQKVRFKSDGDGPGVVTLDERRVTYLGPLDGGVADLDLMVQLDLTPAPAWRLINADGNYIDIPTNAMGVEALFDVFLALPGIKTEYMLSVLQRTRPAQMTVWMAPDHKPYTRLH
ncbi:hypothetical protein L0664_08915 [Octadecabacter sp. G9-8]|uniref:Uncharacterized protein n=1 Tax=Octadecabacter dasysiphoniae TaxID=2909341 RepID=A0ABS9CYD6_9RHOB|nr:hypothetical protein [Octadecabacter dasysiphoniae]MCF2871186.1 hypothetical protein [Octadecabacter dasysiphoniae]